MRTESQKSCAKSDKQITLDDPLVVTSLDKLSILLPCSHPQMNIQRSIKKWSEDLQDSSEDA